MIVAKHRPIPCIVQDRKYASLAVAGASLDQFSFYLSFYGLILGLSVAQVASGFLNAIGARHKVKIGWLTPALAIFIFLDITSFWIYAWGMRESITITWGSMYVGLLIAIVYFLASGLVFPRNIEEWPDLDTHYWKHKGLVIGGILIPNIIGFVQTTMMHPPELNLAYWYGQGTYWPPVLLLLVTRRRWQDLTLLVISIVGYLTNAFIPSWII